MSQRQDESGTTLIEVLVALGVLAFVAVIFVGGIGATSRAATITDEVSIASSLARSQMEYAKKLAYTDNATSYTPDAIPSYSEYTGYSANITATPVGVSDLGVQKITVTINHASKTVLNLEAYKVNR